MAEIIYLSLKKGITATDYWDHTFLNEFLADIDVKSSDRTVIVIPGAYQGDIISEINKEISQYKKVMVFVMSEEENKFNVYALKHPDMILYSQWGNGGKMFPLGYPPKTRETFKALGVQLKNIDWFFSGQITHGRRRLLDKELKDFGGGIYKATDGFAKGMPKEEYLEIMNRSKVVPSPAGVITPESFRLYEALECGAIPVADDQSPLKSSKENYWTRLFGSLPFPVFIDYKKLRKLIQISLSYKEMNNWVYAWWINKKHQIKEELRVDLGIPTKQEMVVIIPTSPIHSNPSTEIIEKTIASVRHHTDSPILITFDGVRTEQEEMRSNYVEFTKRMLWKCNFEYKNVLPVIFFKHRHQSGMMRSVLENIEAPLILYVEHDTPLTTNAPIDWDFLKETINSGKSNMIRFHFEASIPKPHRHLMIGEPENDLIKTRQWSQRPHLANVDFYRFVMDFFSGKSNCFIEDLLHSKLQEANWLSWKVHIYHPEGSIKRSCNLDGRGSDHKFNDEQIW